MSFPFTGLLQPLDVAVNRSYQQYFGDRYDEFVTAALANSHNRTKAGNIKSPTTLEVSQWTSDWAKTQSCEVITKAFVVCGLVHPDKFRVEDLHEPLRRCFDENFNYDEWLSQFPDIIEEYTNDEWEFTDSEQFSFLKTIYKFVETFEDFSTLAGQVQQ